MKMLSDNQIFAFLYCHYTQCYLINFYSWYAIFITAQKNERNRNERNCRFDHIYWINRKWKSSFFVQFIAFKFLLGFYEYLIFTCHIISSFHQHHNCKLLRRSYHFQFHSHLNNFHHLQYRTLNSFLFRIMIFHINIQLCSSNYFFISMPNLSLIKLIIFLFFSLVIVFSICNLMYQIFVLYLPQYLRRIFIIILHIFIH